MTYRPEGWPERADLRAAVHEEYGGNHDTMQGFFDGREAGADAMLAALKADGNAQHRAAGEWIETVAEDTEFCLLAGTWVFIPDNPGETLTLDHIKAAREILS